MAGGQAEEGPAGRRGGQRGLRVRQQQRQRGAQKAREAGHDAERQVLDVQRQNDRRGAEGEHAGALEQGAARQLDGGQGAQEKERLLLVDVKVG